MLSHTLLRRAPRVAFRAIGTVCHPDATNVSASHWDEAWDNADINAASDTHCMATWGPGAGLRGLPILTHGEGVYLYDDEGNKYMDWTSQAVCANLGYSVPPEVKEAIIKQVESIPYTYGGLANTEIRVRVATLLSELLPANINGLLFPSGGAEANEAAIRIARRYTGKTKIINHYRSYHGGSSGALNATGDFRRNFVDADGGAPGFVKTMNPTDADSNLFSFGATEEERSRQALAFLEEQIMCEGPNTIAAVMLESICGSGGVYVAPKGYMEGVRALCDKYDILMIADEVMVGFGRTGTFWGFQNYDFTPDIVTSAKGLTAAYLPLSMVAVSDPIKEYFETNPLGWGATFHAHPMSLACAYECVKFMLKENLFEHTATTIAPIMKRRTEALTDKYTTVARSRAIGAFGCLDLVGADGQRVQRLDGSNCSNPDAVLALRKGMKDNGLYGFLRPPFIHCAPALVIQPDELEDGFDRLDRAVAAFDAVAAH